MALDWANERYVRIYTRETADTAAWSWQARALWPWLIARADGAGLIETTKGAAGVAAVVRLPLELVEVGLAELVADRSVIETDQGYAVRNYIEAQTARATDTSRKARQRERDRAVAASQTVRDTVTRGHTRSHAVTKCPAEVTPSRAEPSREDPLSLGPVGARDPSPPAPELAAPLAAGTVRDVPAVDAAPSFAPACRLAALALELLNAARVELDASARPLPLDNAAELAVAAAVRPLPEAERESAIRHAVAVVSAAVRAGVEPVGSLRPGELFGPRSFGKWQAATVDDFASRSTRGRSAPPGARASPTRKTGVAAGLAVLARLQADQPPEPDR